MKNYIEESKRIIQNNSKNNKLVVFVGAGVSANSGIPTWSNIINKIKKKTDINTDEKDYLKVAQYYYNSRDKKEYYEFLESELNIDTKPNEIHDKLLELNPYHIITTNYDNLIEQQAIQKGMFYDVVRKDEDLPYTPNNKMIIKMHGDFKNRNIVFKEDDYLSYSQNFKLIETYIKSLFSTHTILFVGYSLSDPDIQYIFQWVKDILGNDLPRPYFLKIGKENEFDINEYQYYKNKGINILYYSEIDEKLRKELEESSKGIDNPIGKKTLCFIKYILDDYKKNFQIGSVYDFIDEFEKINYVDKNIVIKLLHQKLGLGQYADFEIIGNTLFLYNDNADEFIKQIRDSIKYKTHQFQKIVNFLDRAGIKFIIKRNNMKIMDKQEIIYRNRNVCNFLENEETIKMFDFKALKTFITNTDDDKEKNNYKLRMERAYSLYCLEEYYDSYKEYKAISEMALRNKEYVIYAISEFNRYYVGKIISTYWFRKKTIWNKVRNEIEKIDLDKILLQFPLKKEEREFLKSIINFNFTNSRIYEMMNMKQKVEKDANTCYIWIDKKSTGIYKIQRAIEEFWKFIKYNMLAVDKEKEVTGIFLNYIDSILKNYSTTKIIHNKEETALGETSENIKIEEITLFDLMIMLEYINFDDLKGMFQIYEIKKIKVGQEDIKQFIIMVKNCIDFIANKIKYYSSININKILLILSFIELDAEQYKEINEYIIKYANSNCLGANEFKYINKYLYYQYKLFNNYELSTLANIINKCLESIQNQKYILPQQKSIIHNIAYYIEKNDKNYKLKNVIDGLTENLDDDIYIIIIELYNILDRNEKNKVNKLIQSKLNEEEFNKSHCEIYYEALIRKIIKPKIKYENKYFSFIKEKKESNIKEGIMFWHDNLDQLLGMTTDLLLNNYILGKEKFGSFLGLKEEYDFLYNINEFPVKKFKVKWLYNYNDKMLEDISKNLELKQEIKEQIERMILEEEKIDNELLKKYVKYFSK